MGLETGTYVSDLVPTNPPTSDLVSQGDDHLRLLKSVLQNTFPTASKAFRFPRVLTKTANYSVVASDDNTVIVADATSAAVGLTLPTLVSGDAGWMIRVHAANVTNAVTITPPSGTISGEASVSLTKQYANIEVHWTGSTFIYEQDNLARKLRTVTGNRILGRSTGAAGEYEELTLTGASVTGGVFSTDILPPIPPQGLLTVSTLSGLPITTTDTVSANIFYDFWNGDLVPVPDGTNFTMRRFTRLTLALDATVQTAGNFYDVFLINDAGTLRIGTGPAWQTVTVGAASRGTGAGKTELMRLHGLYVNAQSINVTYGTTAVATAAGAGLYLGTIWTSTAGSVTVHRTYGQLRFNQLWNMHNRLEQTLKEGDSTASWTYATGTWRQSRADANNVNQFIIGLVEDVMDNQFLQNTQTAGGASVFAPADIGIGHNQSTAPNGVVGYNNITASTGVASDNLTSVARYHEYPALGRNQVFPLELGSGNATYFGGGNFMQLSTRWQG